MTEFITKTSGLVEPYNEAKLIRSLRSVGANDSAIQDILDEIHKQFPIINDSQQIFAIALEKLKQINTGVASRYNLKKALIEFGPAGFPFEQFIAAVFQAQGYKVETNIIAQGMCVTHELDVVAFKDNVHHIIECKFHNNQRYKSDVKVSLYIKARFDDLLKKWQKQTSDTHKAHQAWIVTNTTFTEDAIQFAECVGISPLSWNYPQGHALKDIIGQYKLHPITALVSLTDREKKLFLDNGLVLCRDAQQYKKNLLALGMKADEIDALIKEAQSTCSIDTMP
jgi:Holliday junction resolvase-like predicted endonuclease